MRISMDGRGRYLPSHRNCVSTAGQWINIFIERLWRSLKQEAVYLEEIHDGFAARRVIKSWMVFYNSDRPHSTLDRQTPDDAFFDTEPTQKAA